MPKKFYTSPDNNYPDLLSAILEATRYYICTLLYPNFTYAQAKERFVLASITPSFAFRGAELKQKLSNAKLPFTAYSMGDFEPNTDTDNSFGKSMNYYSSQLSSPIYTRPMIQPINMITFYSRYDDMDRAKTLFFKEDGLKTKLNIPITINSVSSIVPLLVEFEISRGSYASEFEEQLTVGNISDIVHNLKLKYHDLVLNTDSSYPVDEIYFSLGDLNTIYDETPTYFAQNVLCPSTPEISSTDPTDSETNVPVENSIIINFSEVMDEQSVEDAILIIPTLSANFIWNGTSTQVAIDPVESMPTSTEYTISIADTAKSGVGVTLEEDYEFSFTTEV